MTGLPQGELSIEIRSGTGVGQEVRIRSSRPLALTRVFEGRPVEDVPPLISTLYSVCGTAQAVAALRACEAALQVRVAADHQVVRDLAVMVEANREQLFRVLLAWPALIGIRPDGAQAARSQRLAADWLRLLGGTGGDLRIGGVGVLPDAEALRERVGRLESLLEEAVFGVRPGEWSEIATPRALRAWAREGRTPSARLIERVVERRWCELGRCGIPPLPLIGFDELEARLSRPWADAFIAAPSWQGRPHETTPYSRQLARPLLRRIADRYGNGLLARLVGTLMELAAAPAELARLSARLARPAQGDSNPAGVHSPRQGVGMARVEAARGLLVHRVELAGERIGRYQILAPTEWNFHPEGLLAQGLARPGPGRSGEIRQAVELFVTAVDPCVGFTLELS